MDKKQASEFIERIKQYGDELTPKQTIKMGNNILKLKSKEAIKPEFWR